MNIRVSVIIPTYNRGSIIKDTLDSIIAQTYSDWECIVVDDFSLDNTSQILEEYVRKDSRFKVVVNKFSKGAPGARNTGVEIAIGEFICFFDSDDLMYPNHLESKMYIASQFPDVGVFTSYSHLLNESNEIMGSFNYNAEGNIFNDLLLEKTYVDTNSALIRKSTLTESIRWDEKCPSYQEWDFHLQLSKLTTYKTVPEYLSGYYRRTQGTISSDGIRTIHGRWFVFLKYRKDMLMEFDKSVYEHLFMSNLKESVKVGFDPLQHFEFVVDDSQLIRKFKRLNRRSWFHRIFKL